MYLANPILLLGAFGLGLALLLLPWRISVKTEAMKRSVNGILTMLTVLGVTWTALGAVVGFNHMAVHGGCLQQQVVWNGKRAVKAEADKIKAKANEELAKLTPEQKAELEAKLTPDQKAKRDADRAAAEAADKAYQEAEKQFMATCNTIIARYAKTK